MKARVQLALMGCVASIFAHLYLTMHYYPLKFGFAAGQSICNLNAKFDCDAAAASSYASLFGIPLSVWGMVTNGVLFIMILLSWLEWSENPERLKRWTILVSGLSLAASVVMAVISFTQMQSYCLFCLTLYVLSALIFFAFRGLLKEPFAANFKDDLGHLGEAKVVLLALVAIPAMAYLTHQMFMQNLGDAQIEKIAEEAVVDWAQSPKQNFVAKPSLAMGPLEGARMTLAEFADFRCGHCKHASYTLDAFVKSHPDVRFEFYAFPLDGACNEKIESSNGISCRLAVAVLCAEKENKGWEMHHALYAAQDEVNRLGTPTELDPVLSAEVSKLGLNWERIQTCMADPSSMDAIRAQAKQGVLVNVMGTPTIFANGRVLNRAQLIPVLEAARNKAADVK